MFYSLFPLILIFASLTAIIVIVARKFPPLVALDVEKLPEVKQAKVKDEIKFQKFWQFLRRLGSVLKERLKFFGVFAAVWYFAQTKFRRTVHRWQEKYKKSIIAEVKEAVKEAVKEKAAKRQTKAPDLAASAHQKLLKQAEEAVGRGDLTLAERRYIETIKLNPRELEAYRGLGKVYLEMKKYKEAKETFEFLLKLKPDDDRAYNRLAMVAEAQGKIPEAIRCLEEAVRLNDHQAVRFYDLGRLYAAIKRPAAGLRYFAKATEIEPNNPKYLDQLLEMSIITGDVDLARETYERLRLVNPDNQKLAEFKQRIEEMEE